MRTPNSTYRIQLSPSFTFDDATEILPYLAKLRVDWVYLSPILQSASGSDHGYDVVDPTRVDEARGGRDGFVRFANAAHKLGLGVLVDIVPNHMGVRIPQENPWWWDVLTHGRESRYAHYFDIDWDAGGGKLLLPVIGDDDMPKEPGAPIQGMWADRGVGVLRYYDHEFPLTPGSADNPEAGTREIHDAQHYELVHWRQGDWNLNYRRFFTVTELAGLRVELDDVWEDAHREILSWVAEGLVDGLRIDHPDGLRDPAGYLQTLRERTGLYISVEKILEPGEQLPAWPVAGTTGYDALGEIDRVLVDPDGELELSNFAASLSHQDLDDWETLAHSMKRFVTDGPLHAEMRRITRELAEAGVTGDTVTDALSELAASFAVYRTYLPDGADQLQQAARRAADWRGDLTDDLERILAVLSDPNQPAAARFQQTTGMVMAKAIEDRAFYRYSRLTSLNEVGGDPSQFALTPTQFAQLQQDRLQRWPHAQTALSTHDTKRSEDVRARIDVLSEVPDLWQHTLNGLLDIAPIRNRGFANLLWQAVVGAWPIERERLHDYATKAAREAGDVTTWTDVDEDYEAELHRAIDAAYNHPAARALLSNLLDRIRVAGWSNSLTMKALQLLGPGSPDVYQGSELWLRALVDPDNRRPVDYRMRAGALDAILHGERPVVDESGARKLLLTVMALDVRKHFGDQLDRCTLIPARGVAAEHVIAIDRGEAVVVGTRLPIGLQQLGGWQNTELDLPVGTWQCRLTGYEFSGTARVADVLADDPATVLVRTGL